MKRTIQTLAIIMITLGASSAFARNVWRECGIGGMIFRGTGWAAITSNIIWDLGTTATSSNVSSDDLCEGKGASTAKFIFENYASLEEQTAAGQGEHLSAMLNNLNCEAGSQAAIITSVRTDMAAAISSASFAQKTQSQKAEGYYNSVIKNAQISKACGAI